MGLQTGIHPWKSEVCKKGCWKLYQQQAELEWLYKNIKGDWRRLEESIEY